MPKEEAEETKQKTKASTNGTAAGVKLGRTKGNEAENQVSRTGRNRLEMSWDGRGKRERRKKRPGTVEAGARRKQEEAERKSEKAK